MVAVSGMSRRNRGNSTHEAVLRSIHGIRRHMAAWSIADKVILCLSVAALVVATAEWIMNPPHTVVGTLLAVLLCLILALMPWKSHMAAWCMIFVGAIGDLLVGVDSAGPSTTWATLLAMVSLGRTTRAWECVLSLVITLSTVTYAAIRYPDIMGYGIPDGIANLGVSLLCVYLIGVSIRYRQLHYTQQETQRQIEQTQRNQFMASLFHEAVSGNLTRIIVSAECIQRKNPDVYERCGIANIVHYADDALRQTHQAIDMLQQNDMVPGAAKRITVQAAVTSVMASGDRRLHDLEYQGCSDVQGECNLCVDQRSLVFLALLREVYTNIERHCDPHGSTYRIHIKLTGDRVLLSQTNGTTRTEDWIPAPESGRGLSLLSKQIRRYGGMVNMSTDDEQWQLSCSMPLVGDGDGLFTEPR